MTETTKPTKPTGKLARGAALVKKAVAAAKETGAVGDPAPVSAAALKKLRLPNDEKLPASLKEALAFDAGILSLEEFDEDEPEFDAVSLEDVIEQEFGEDAVEAFGEAYELLGDDCIFLGDEGGAKNVLYIGNPDDAGEYPVVTLHFAGAARVNGFVPFDAWVARRLGLLPAQTPGEVPAGYEAAADELASSNAEGKRDFEPGAREGHDEDEDEDEEAAEE